MPARFALMACIFALTILLPQGGAVFSNELRQLIYPTLVPHLCLFMHALITLIGLEKWQNVAKMTQLVICPWICTGFNLLIEG